MKYLKDYSQLYEGIRGAMKPKSDDDIEKVLSGLNVYDRIYKIKDNGLSLKYYPNDEEIRTYLSGLGTEDMCLKITELGLDKKFLPSDEKIKEYLSELDDVRDIIETIESFELDKTKFFPPDEDIKKYLSEHDIEDWLEIVYDLELDRDKFSPTDEDVLEHVLPNEIKYDKEKSTLEFDEWSDFSDLFKLDRDTVDDYVESVLSGDGRQYFEIHETQDPDYFDIPDKEKFKKFKNDIKEKIDELDVEDEDGYDDFLEEFNTSCDDFSGLYTTICDYDHFLDDIKDAIRFAYTNAQESANESEAYDGLVKCIEKAFDAGDYKYEDEKFIMPISVPSLDVDNILDDNRFIEWEIPYYGWSGDVDVDLFLEDFDVKLEEI